jgi:cytochrome c oxidase assembly protein subunit 15
MPLSTESLLKASLFVLTLMIILMVMVGGLTRLTGSGLSIVEWKPVTGFLPPFSFSEWMDEFAKYKTSPEFQKINPFMTLSDFQSIFWLEYIHRLGGRLLSLVLLIPTLIALLKKPYRTLLPFLALLWALGAAQGVMGWMMVKSGLVNDPFVSPYRLAAHLLLGFAIFGVSLWTLLTVYKPSRLPFSSHRLIAALCLVLLTAFLGALVAGFKAGLLYPTFPLMGGQLIPPELSSSLLDPASLQFFHRLSACITFLYCLWVSFPFRYPFGFIGGAAFIQFSLGIATLVGGVPVSLALLHQGFAFVLFGSILYTLFLTQKN